MTPTERDTDMTQRLVQWLKDEGAVLGGVAAAGRVPGADVFMEWLRQGQQADMGYLSRTAAKRTDPRLVLAGCRSVVVGAWPTGRRPVETPPGHGRLAAYVGEADYHETMGGALKRVAACLRQALPGEAFAPYVDTGPVLEREWAALAGLGWLGKNTLLIHPHEGSYLLLGVILSTANLTPTASFEGHHCGTCTRCLDACPTQALSAQNGLDSRRCLSYWSIEHKGDFSAATPGREQWQNWLYGCDICQEVCPFNRHTPSAHGVASLPLEGVADGTASGPAFLRRGKEGIKRNARWMMKKKG